MLRIYLHNAGLSDVHYSWLLASSVVIYEMDFTKFFFANPSENENFYSTVLFLL